MKLTAAIGRCDQKQGLAEAVRHHRVHETSNIRKHSFQDDVSFVGKRESIDALPLC